MQGGGTVPPESGPLVFEFFAVVGCVYGLWFSLGKPNVFSRGGAF